MTKIYYYYHAESDCYMATINPLKEMDPQVDEISKERFAKHEHESRDNINWTCKWCEQFYCCCWERVYQTSHDYYNN